MVRESCEKRKKHACNETVGRLVVDRRAAISLSVEEHLLRCTETHMKLARVDEHEQQNARKIWCEILS